MTRKRGRRSNPPSFDRAHKPPAGGPKRGQGGESGASGQAERPPRPRRSERRESKVSLIYGFHSVAAALKAPRRELIRLYATAAAAERLGAEIAARGLETRIMSPEEISARSPRECGPPGALARGAAARANRRRGSACGRPGAGSGPDHRPSQRRRDPANRRRFRRGRAGHDRAPLARIRRNFGQISFWRAGARADLQRHQSGAGARRDGGHGLLADRARFRGGDPT